MLRLLVLCLLFCTSVGIARASDAAPNRPTLVLVISVDQFSANLFEEWRPRYTAGIARLANGIVYSSGYHTHALTDTCPGHSVLLTGKHPNKTGIVANLFTDARGKTTYCVADQTVTLAHDASVRPVGPANLMATTLGDWLKEQSPKSRVLAISGKDRAAITLGGHRADGVYWVVPSYGFTTYVRPGTGPAAALAPLSSLNARSAAIWRHPPVWTYRHPDCKAAAGTWSFGQVSWQSKLPPVGWDQSGSAEVDEKEIAARVMMSPLLDELTATGASELVRQLDLGRGPDPDLLAVSFSGTDYIGHHFGTRGPEMCEQMYRLDAAIGRLLTELDRRHIDYIAVLTADHGGSDFPERLSKLGYPRAQRLPDEDILGRVNRIVMTQLGLPSPPLSGSIDEQTLHVERAGREGVLDSVVKALRAQPEVVAAFTREELLNTPIHAGVAPEEVPLKERYAMSVFPERSADVLVALEPLVYPLDVPRSSKDYIETHGSPWDYDRRVPIVFWWSGARSETRYIPVETVDIAPTLAAVIGISAPQDVDGRCLPLDVGRRSICPCETR
jgi:predicted AlkP superfamily pyrophosphatase or phosphodiesterase